MKQIGFLVETLGTSQFGLSLISECNKLKDIDVSIFYEEFDRIPVKPYFSLLQNMNAWTFKGPLISTCLKTTYLLTNLPNARKRLFYVWNLEWLYNKYDWSSISHIYQNDDIILIARSKSHYRLLKKMWKEPEFILEDFNHDIITKIANKYN